MPSQTQTQVKLDFPEKLIQSGKKENTDALLKRIKTLHQRLAALEQDNVDVRSLDPIRKPLIHQTILHHKDRGVKIYAACCLADVLRLYAPDAPYTGDELRDIFQFFLAQLENLRAPRITDVAYYSEYCYLLESLATIKSVVLACDVPDGDVLVARFFQDFMDIIRPDMSKNLIRYMVDILVVLIEESASIPSGVMDCIIEQFTKPSTSSSSFQLIVEVCNRASDKLYRPVYAHFAEIQTSHGRNPDSNDLKILTESHILLLNIYSHCPALLLNVIPLLEENLKVADEIPLRQLSTKTLGTMFGERPVVGAGVADVAKAYPAAWRAWLGRRVDKALVVRLAWVEAARGVLAKNPELRKEMEEALVDRIQDADERVRAAICKVIGSLDFETALHHLDAVSLKAVGARMSDKKASVRQEAAAGLSKLWSLGYNEIESNNAHAIRQLGWVPDEMLRCLLRKDAPPDLRNQITTIFRQVILPLPAKADDEQAWVDRLLLVASRLLNDESDESFVALERLTGLRGYAKGASPYRTFIVSCEEYNGGVVDSAKELVKARLAFVTRAIASFFADADKARKDIEAFAAANEARLYKLFKTCADPQTNLRDLIKARNEFLRKLEQSHTDILETFTFIIDDASFNIINKTAIPLVLKAAQRPPAGRQGEAIAAASFRILKLIAKECAPMYRDYVQQLVIVMNEKKNDRLCETALRALSAICKVEPESAPQDRKVAERAMKLALEGTVKQAKLAARFLANSKHKDLCVDLIKDLVEQSKESEDDHILSHLRALAELALSAPSAFEQESEEIIRFVIDDIMAKPSPSTDDTTEDAWTDEENLNIHDRAKLIGMKICAHRCLGYAREADAAVIFRPTLQMLVSILKHEGAVNENTMEGGYARTHMRLRATLCLLKLAKVRVFDKAMTEYFQEITYTIQDPVFQVRNRFLHKLLEVLPAQRLLPRWNVLPALSAKDPEAENILLVGKSSYSERIDRVEMPLARLMLLLSHHPDFTWDPENMKDIATFIALYLDCIATRDNVSLLYLIAGKIKTVRDSLLEAPEDNENLYKLSELTQIIIRNRAQVHSWSITSYPGKIKLPRDIFHNLTDPAAVNRNLTRKYLDDETDTWAKNLGKKAVNTAGPSRKFRDSSSTTPTKKRVRKTKPAARKKAKRTDEDEDDPSESDDDDEAEGESSALSAPPSEDEVEDGVEGRGGKRGAKVSYLTAICEFS
ncbi:hypothetical protein M231_07377 [Tremella mesenterica]|uniref:Sister chromatid cohesion protein PDS5 n=1 Tax=Tremella mesenterica TaxID=5217 RepID=A0A4Q1BE92_TREME|nr:hypothetical protein M231_07377 [Tremella mesenterica]